jgi:hypothetical protein
MKNKRFYFCLLILAIFGFSSAFGQKAPKAGTTEYKASQKASLVALDSLLKNYRNISNEITIENLQTFVDKQCAKYKYDPDFMTGVADLFMTSLGNEGFSAQRYAEIKKKYPNSMEAYLSEGNLFFQFAWREYPTYNAEFLQKAKAQVDSAKILFPKETEPYMRWAYWQAPYRQVRQTGYENLSVDYELAELKKKFPDYPCYREMARYYIGTLAEKKDKISTDNRDNYIVYSAEFYGKEDRKLMTDAYIVDYADICNQTNDRENLEKGLDILNYGMNRNPDYPYFYRFKMYIQANLAGIYGRAKEKEKSDQAWKDVVETGTTFFTKYDSIGKLLPDFKCMALANRTLKQYDKAIDYYRQQMNLEKDSISRLETEIELIYCYYLSAQYQKVIDSFRDYEIKKKSAGQEMSSYDYQFPMYTYRNLANDTTQSVEDRIRFYNEADSLYVIYTKLSPEDAVSINYERLDNLIKRYQLEYGIFGGEQIILPEFYEATERLIQSVLATQPNISDMNYLYLMIGYDYQRQHYISANKFEDAFRIAEIMTSVDMPSEFELNSLNDGQKSAYAQMVNDAQKTYNDLRPTYGKKKGRR